MYKKIFISAAIILHAVFAFSQDTSISKGWGNLNYSIPESPAFKILDVQPSSIMRPTTTKEIAVSVGNYYLNNGASIPKNFAVEVSPSLFTKLSLKEYQKNSWWYNSAFSLATKQNDDGSYSLATGIKCKLIDKADLRTNKEFNDYTSKIGGEIRDIESLINYKIIQEIGIAKFNTGVNNPSSTEGKLLAEKKEKYKDESLNALDKKLIAYRKKFQEDNWNKQVWDIGFAAIFNSKDSLIKNLVVSNKIGLWSTFGLPICKTKGQLLIGVNGQLKDSGQQKLNVGLLNLGSRLYYGSNDTKGFIESEANFISHELPVFKLSVGVETTLYDGFWISLGFGIKKIANQDLMFVPSINVALGNGSKTVSK